MVAAVFHMPRAARSDPEAATPATPAPVPASIPPAALPAAPPVTRAAARRIDRNGSLARLVPPVLGLALLVGVWALLTMGSTTFPTPKATFDAALRLFADPFYRKGPNDQGIGWNV